MKLIIAEKKEVATAVYEAFKTNESIEEKNYYKISDELILCYTYGHILALVEPKDKDEKYNKWSLDFLPLRITWELKPVENRKHLLDTIEKFLKKADEVIHLGDPDDEGQLIVDEVLEFFKYKKPVKRLFLSDNTVNGIKKAWEKMTDNTLYKYIAEATKGRSVCDLMYGVDLTVFFTVTNKSGTLNVGRVQTPTLNRIVERDKEIENHTKEKYFSLKVNSTINRSPDKKIINEFEEHKLKMLEAIKNKEKVDKYWDKLLRLSEEIKDKDIIFDFIPLKDNPVLEDGFIKNKDYLEAIISESKDLNILFQVERKIVKEEAPLPFNLNKLQAYCDKKWGYSLEETDSTTQSLRDKYKAITYNRTDSQYLSSEHFQERKENIESTIKNLSLNINNMCIDIDKKSKAFDDSKVSAHHGIIPTISSQNINLFTEKERNIYTVICKYYLSQFLSSKVIEQIKIEGNFKNGFNDNELLRATQNIVIEEGFNSFLNESNEENKMIENDLSWLLKKEYTGTLYSFKISENETKAKQPYTQGSLVTELTSISKYCKNPEIKKIMKKKDEHLEGESGGIGTGATRSKIIKELIKREFIEEIEKGKRKILKSTQKGKEFINILPDLLKEVDLTAHIFLDQEKIKSKEMTLNEMIDKHLEIIREMISKEYPKLNYEQQSKQDKKELTKCICGGSIFESEKSYYCSDCKKLLVKNNNFYGKLSSYSAKKLFKGEEIIIKNLESKTGKKYDGTFILDNSQEKFFSLKLKINNENDNTKKEKFTTCICGGEIYENTMTYHCNSCKKTLYKDSKFYGKISKTNAKKLFEGKEILLENLTGKFGLYSGFFTLNSDNDKYFGFNFIRKIEINKNN